MQNNNLHQSLSRNLLTANICSENFSDNWQKSYNSTPQATDILLNIPVGYELQLHNNHIGDIPIGSKVALEVTIANHANSGKYNRFSKKQLYQIFATTNNGVPICLIFFKIFPSQIAKFATGTKHKITGKLEESMNQYRIIHPQPYTKNVQGIDVITKWNSLNRNNIKNQQGTLIQDQLDRQNANQNNEKVTIKPIYQLPKSITQEEYIAVLNKCLEQNKQILTTLLNNSSIHNTAHNAYNILHNIHHPTTMQNLYNTQYARRAMAFLEIMASRLAMHIARSKDKEIQKQPIKTEGKMRNEIIQQFGFELTKDQSTAIAEIQEDQLKANKMFRLLQGDVGSGKTLVALIAMINAVEANRKALIIAPTTILAAQHYRFISDITFGMNINVFLLTGKTKASERKRIKEGIANNNLDIIVGTHAVIQSDYIKDFSICVIDEQHRFGVQQRADLATQHPHADILMMTATPIPRTMLSILYDNVNVSSIKTMPKCRQDIVTSLMSRTKYNDIVNSIKNKVNNQNVKIYWVCPSVDETADKEDNNTDPLISVKERFKELSKVIDKEKVLIIHGKMTEQEKSKSMTDFMNSNGAILISTTVIEVGVNVPDATIIIIEQAERFGLSQLHQLRGRVGRGDKESYCILLYSENAAPESVTKLSIIRNNRDGFEISEQDLKLRGAGEIMGVKQSGYGSFKIANEELDSELLSLVKHKFTKMLPNIRNTQEQNQISLLFDLFGYKNNILNLIKG